MTRLYNFYLLTILLVVFHGSFYLVSKETVFSIEKNLLNSVVISGIHLLILYFSEKKLIKNDKDSE